MILAGDVGGTNTRLGLYRRVGGRLRPVRGASFASRAHRSIETVIEAFLGDSAPPIRSAVLGVAGPIAGGKSRVVNLRRSVDERSLKRVLETQKVRVINDLEAAAWGIPELGPRGMASLTPRLRSRAGDAAIISAGTGLGTAVMRWDGKRHHPRASEGGHQAFAPRDDLEIELLRFLRRRHRRVSLERVISGPGLLSIYEFLIAAGRGRKTRAMTRRLDGADDPNAVVSRAAVNKEDATASKALKLFVSLFGAAAGDLALVAGALGGVYVGGGIAPEILPELREGGFMRAFCDKGRLSSFVRDIPVRVILDPRVALLGAAAYAAKLDER